MSEERPEENRNLPVLAADAAQEARPIERVEAMPLSQPVAAATGGFLAGLAALTLVRVLRAGGGRRLLRRRRRQRGLEIVGSRSFLVDVHVLKR